MYAEQIEAEKDGTWTTTYFTDTFGDAYGGGKWVCPKVDFIEDLFNFQPYVSSCKVAKGKNATYLADITCNETPVTDFNFTSVFLKVTSVSTNLDSDLYFKTQSL